MRTMIVPSYAPASGGERMSTLKQRLIEWAQALPDDCTVEDVKTGVEAYLGQEQARIVEGASRQDTNGTHPNNLARLEALGQEAAKAGLNAKLAAIQAYLAKRGRTG